MGPCTDPWVASLTSKLGRSVAAAVPLLTEGDLSADDAVRQLLELTHARRHLDLSDLSPQEQAAMIASTAEALQPSEEAMAQRIAAAAAARRPFVAKLGIDPTGAEIHIGHAVPMITLSRLQRMGHRIVLIVGDMTAKIGDPSGRSDERPHLGDDEIAANLATYKEQVAPFFDFSHAELRHNSDWLGAVTLPRLIEVTSRIPVSMSLQREDFRSRLAAGHSLTLAELLYSVAMALDSVQVNCDVEIGGIDQYLNMQMCRKVMEICALEPELVVANPLIEGTDGTGAKMSKSRNNYVALTAPPGEVFGKLMSVPDRLMGPYLRALSEWQPAELAAVAARQAAGTLHPMDLKKVMAGEVTACLHGVDAAMVARAEFVAQFSKSSYSSLTDLPEVPARWLDAAGAAAAPGTVADALKALGFAASNGEVRRVAEQKGLRLVLEKVGTPDGGPQEEAVLSVDEIRTPLGALLDAKFGAAPGECFLKFGRKLARVAR